MQFMLPSYPSENSKSKATHYGIYPGGPSTNAAITSAFLGSNTTLLTSIGQNPFTKMIETELEKYNVHFIDIDYANEVAPPFASVITSANNGDRTVFSYHPEKEDEECFFPDYLLDHASSILIDGFYPDLALKLCMDAKKRDLPIILDGGSWKKTTMSLLPYVDIAICSEHFSPSGRLSPGKIIEKLKKEGVKKIAITRGGNPIIGYENDKIFEIRPMKIKPVDTLGAGDIFHGAFVHFFSQGNNFFQSLKAASHVAAFSCKSFGTREWMKNFSMKNELENNKINMKEQLSLFLGENSI